MNLDILDNRGELDFSKDLEIFIHKADSLFVPTLSSRTDLKAYSAKLYKEAIVLAIRDDENLKAVSAFYCTPDKFDYAFLSFVTSYQKGLGSELLKKMISECKKLNVKGIETQTWESNTNSLKMFKRFNFVEVGKADNRNDGVQSVLLKLTFND